MKTEAYLLENLADIERILASKAPGAPCVPTHKFITRASDGFTYCLTCSANYLNEASKMSRLKMKLNRYRQLLERINYK